MVKFDQLSPMQQSAEKRDEAERRAKKALDTALKKLKANLLKVEAHNRKIEDSNPAVDYRDYAIEILKEDVLRIIKDLKVEIK